MIYSATHITRHLYQSPVSQSLNELCLTPRSLTGQQVREVNICIEPEPATWLPSSHLLLQSTTAGLVRLYPWLQLESAGAGKGFRPGRLQRQHRQDSGAGLNVAVTKRPGTEVCCERTGQQLKPFFHWCVCPKDSMAPGRQLNIGEAPVALP